MESDQRARAPDGAMALGTVPAGTYVGADGFYPPNGPPFRFEFDSVTARFRKCALERQEDDRETIKNVLFTAGSQWGRPPTPEEIIAALDGAGFIIARKTTEAP